MSVNKVDKWMRLIERGMYYAPIYMAAYIDLSSVGTIKSLRSL